MALVIEIAGISCSGKSTAIQYFKGIRCSNNIIEAEEYLGGYYKNITDGFFLKDTVINMPIFKFLVVAIEHLKNIFRYRQFYFMCVAQIMKNEGKVKAFRSFFFKIGKYYILEKANVEKIIMDEGPIQVLFSLFINNNKIGDTQIADIKSFIQYAPLADKVIFGPIIPQKTFVSRMMKRGHHRVVGTGEKKTSDRVKFSESEVRKRAELFIAKSVQLQKIIFQEVKIRTGVLSLSDVNEWNKVFDDLCA
ncbi:MAG: hypothetical protein V3U92_11140 [Cellulophaga sp.]